MASHAPSPTTQPKIWVWGLPALILMALHVISFGGFEIDDAYISFRYATNMLDGHGLVFNPGDPVEGYSNFLWVLLSAVGMAMGIDPLLWARILGLGAFLGIMVFVPRMVGRLSQRAAWLSGAGAVFIACCGPLACWSFAGLETSFFALLALLAWGAAVSRRQLSTGILALMLSLSRPDGLALGVAFVLWSLLPPAVPPVKNQSPSRRPWLRWAGLVLFLAGVLAHFLWRHATYGEWLPNTYYAKTGDLVGQLKTGLPYGTDFLRSYLAPWVAVALWAIGTRDSRTLWNQPMRLTLVLCGLWFLYTVLIGGDMLGMFRFYVPILPLLLTTGTVLLGEALADFYRASGWRRAWWAVAAMALLVLLPTTVGKERRLITAHMSVMNLGGWKKVGDALSTQLPPGTSIALGPAGYIPYKTGFKTYDLMGITDRHIAHRQMTFQEGYAGHEKHDGAYILSHRPDYLFLGNVDVTDRPRSGFIPPFSRELDIYQHPIFQREYELTSLPLAGGQYVNCFKRRD